MCVSLRPVESTSRGTEGYADPTRRVLRRRPLGLVSHYRLTRGPGWVVPAVGPETGVVRGEVTPETSPTFGSLSL